MLRRATLVLSLVLLVASTAMWGRSYWVSDWFDYNTPTVSLTAWWGYGTVDLIYTHRMTVPAGEPAGWWQEGFSYVATPASRAHETSLYVWFRPPRRVAVRFPAWLPPLGFTLVGYVTVRPRLVARRRRKRGLCSACKYDLTANVTGICPECGTTVKDGEDGRTRSGCFG